MSVRVNKSDQNDAEDIVELVRVDYYSEVRVKSEESQKIRPLERKNGRLTASRKGALAGHVRWKEHSVASALPPARPANKHRATAIRPPDYVVLQESEAMYSDVQTHIGR